MTRAHRLLALCALLLAAAPAKVSRAQDAARALADGRAAYRAMQYDSARVRLRRGVDLARRTPVADSALAEMHAYLGAAAVQLGRMDEAHDEFVAAVASRPDFRMDTLEFPVAVSRAFDLARSTTAFIDVRTAADTTLAVGVDRQRFTLLASAPHEIRVDLVESGGARRRLYAGAIGERLEVHWDGLDAAQSGPLVGAAELQIRTTAGAPRPMLVQLPLRITPVAAPRAAPPAAPNGSTATHASNGAGATNGTHDPDDANDAATVRGGRIDALVTGLSVAALAAVIPSAVSQRESGSTLRFVVSGAALAAALGGALRAAPAPPRRRPVTAPSQPRPGRVRVQAGTPRRSEP